MKKCGFVIRVSTEEQARNKEGSLTNQLQRLRAHVEYKKTACGEDWEETDRYIMKGISGKDSVRSKEFVRLFEDIKVGKINTVLCTALDRVSRSVKDFLHFFEYLNQYNVEFVCLKQNYDTTSPQGKLFITIMMALAEFEREQTSERNKDASLARSERGLWNGGQILGYDLDPDNKGNLIPNKSEKAIVNFAFDTYLECGSILETAKQMNQRGFRTKEYRSRRDKFHTASEFGHASVQHLLTNYSFMGKKEINKKKKARDQEQLREGQRYRIVDAVWVPIIEEEKFYKVQELLKKNNATKHNGAKHIRHTYILNAGLLWCGECGEQMEGRCGTGSKGVKYYYYLCKNKDCRFKVPASEIEGVIIERIGQLAADPEIMQNIIKTTNEKLQSDLPKMVEQKNVLEADLADVQKTADGIMEQWESLASDDGAVFLKEKLDQLGKRRNQIESALEKIELAVAEIQQDAVDHKLVMKALEDFTDVFNCIPPYQQKDLMRLVLHKAIVSHTSMKIALYGRLPEIDKAAHRADSRSQTSTWLPMRHPLPKLLSVFEDFGATSTRKFVLMYSRAASASRIPRPRRPRSPRGTIPSLFRAACPS
jgi:site-specific DNA recombinase